MAAFTSQPQVRASQREIAEVMIKVGIFPVGGMMAGSAVRAILTVMFVIPLMARVAVHGRAFVLPVHMAGLTSHLRVLTFQFERGEVVIERCGNPTIGGMALAAIQPEAAFVRLIVMMTRVAVRQSHLEISKAARIDMALDTGKVDMFASELE